MKTSSVAKAKKPSGSGVLHFTRRKRNPRIYVETYPRQTVWKATERNANGNLIATKRTTGSPRRIKLNKLPPNFIMSLVSMHLNKKNTESLVKSIPTIARVIQPRLNELRFYSRANLNKIKNYETQLKRRLHEPNNSIFQNLANRYYANYPNISTNENLYNRYTAAHRRRLFGSAYFKNVANNARGLRVHNNTPSPPREPVKINLRNLPWVKSSTHIKNWTKLPNENKKYFHWFAHSANGKTQYKFYPYRTNKGELRITSSKNGVRYHRKARNSYIFRANM